MAVDQLKIVALNILGGGGTRVARLCAYLEDQQAEVIVLTEWRENGQGRDITAWARARGMKCDWLADGGNVNGVFVASKIPFTTRSVTPLRPGNHATRAGVMMLVQTTTWTILACYFPQGNGDPKTGIKPPKPPFFAAIADVAVAHVEKSLIVIGDLNNGHRERDCEGAKFIGPEDFDALSTEVGLVDLWRLTHGNEAREYSWMSAPGRVSKVSNGFRIDHAFANQTCLAQMQPECRYDHQTREKVNGKYEISDHSAVIVTSTATGRNAAPRSLAPAVS
jgi:exodeoxyribonuclease III